MAPQLDYLRRTAYGRLSEVYGAKYLEQDFFFRLLGLGELAQRTVRANADARARVADVVRYYTWGVNDGFKELVGERRPYQFVEAGVSKLAPWRA